MGSNGGIRPMGGANIADTQVSAEVGKSRQFSHTSTSLRERSHLFR